jgi:hypothetical protein
VPWSALYLEQPQGCNGTWLDRRGDAGLGEIKIVSRTWKSENLYMQESGEQRRPNRTLTDFHPPSNLTSRIARSKEDQKQGWAEWTLQGLRSDDGVGAGGLAATVHV